jgi:hypothetical protein
MGVKNKAIDIEYDGQQTCIACTTGKLGFAEHTAKAKKRTTKPLPCVFSRGARQKAHGSISHGKVALPCAFFNHAR